MKDFILKVINYITEDIWRIRHHDTTKRQFFLIKTLRIIYLAIRGFFNDKCQEKASALTFYSLLSVVPVVAMAFGVAKGFGFEEILREEIQSQFTGHEEVVAYINQFAISYLNNTKGGMIAGIGFAILLWAVMNVLSNIENSFNDIWEVKRSRKFIRKFSDYIALMMVAILFVVSSSGMIVFVSQQVGGPWVFDIATSIFTLVAPYVLIWIVFTLMFYIMPNTKVKFSSALFGGIVAGTLFQLVQFGYIHFQVGVSKYNAIYGSFAALPLFLVWLQASWLIVLFGSEMAFAFQNEASFEFEADTENISNSYKMKIVLLVMYHIIKCFENGERPPTSFGMSVALKLPIRLVRQALYALIDSDLIAELNFDNSKESSYHPSRDINKLSIVSIINQLNQKGSADFHFEPNDKLDRIEDILNDFNIKIEQSGNNILLKDI